MKTRGKLKPEELEYIRQNYLTQNDQQIADHLKRDLRTVVSGRKKLGILKTAGGKLLSAENNKNVSSVDQISLQASQRLTEEQRKEFYRTEFTSSLYYNSLKEQFTKEEMDFYLEEWGALCVQFEDIVATEKRQIDELIKVTILGIRILRNVKIAEEQIEESVLQLEAFRKDNPDMADDPDLQEKDAIKISMIRMMQGQVEAMSDKYQRNVETKNKLMGELNARRKDRVEQVLKRGTTFLGLVQAFRDRKLRETQGRHMELVKLSREKKQTEWRKPTVYPDLTKDCILLDEHSETTQNNVVMLDDVKSEHIEKYSKTKNKKILIIDDEQSRQQYFAMILFGNNIEFAKNADSAIELLKSGKYDLICLDFDLGLNQKGSTITDYIVANNIMAESDYLIHSMNKDGARTMGEQLFGRSLEICSFENLKKNFKFGENNAKDS